MYKADKLKLFLRYIKYFQAHIVFDIDCKRNN